VHSPLNSGEKGAGVMSNGNVMAGANDEQWSGRNDLLEGIAGTGEP